MMNAAITPSAAAAWCVFTVRFLNEMVFSILSCIQILFNNAIITPMMQCAAANFLCAAFSLLFSRQVAVSDSRRRVVVALLMCIQVTSRRLLAFIIFGFWVCDSFTHLVAQSFVCLRCQVARIVIRLFDMADRVLGSGPRCRGAALWGEGSLASRCVLTVVPLLCQRPSSQ